MRNISGKNIELWEKNGDCTKRGIRECVDCPHFSLHHNVISYG